MKAAITLLQDVLIVLGILLGVFFVALAWLVKWLLRPALIAALCWVAWHFGRKYW
jgi:hypothetical protein